MWHCYALVLLCAKVSEPHGVRGYKLAMCVCVSVHECGAQVYTRGLSSHLSGRPTPKSPRYSAQGHRSVKQPPSNAANNPLNNQARSQNTRQQYRLGFRHHLHGDSYQCEAATAQEPSRAGISTSSVICGKLPSRSERSPHSASVPGPCIRADGRE